MRTDFLVLAAAAGLSAVIFAPAAAEDSDGVELTAGPDLSAFKAPTDGWTFAAGVKIDPANPKRLTIEPGSGVLVTNGKDGKGRDLVTKQKFGDVDLHVEFLIPKGSNSGVKLHGHYEIQIFDSYGKATVKGDDCGGIYPRAELEPRYHHIDDGIAPKTNACKPAGEWQTFDIQFRAPRFDAAGQRTEKGRFVKVVFNGTLIHDNVELDWPTGNNWKNKEMAEGPILFQGDHGQVAFRNVRVKPLKDAGK